MRKAATLAWTRYAFVLISLGMRLASTPTANLSYLLLAAYALFGRAQAIQALALSWLFSMLSPGIAAEATAASVGRYAVLAAAAASVLWRSALFGSVFRIKPITLATILLGLFFIIHSFLFSPLVDVSVLKAVSWMVAMTTLIAAWLALEPEERELLARQILMGLVMVMVVSLPLLVLPVGYLRNGTGFQGVLGHPQAFGPTMALLGAWAASQMLGYKRPPWFAVGLVATCLVLVVLSEARTAGLAMVLGVGIAALTVPVLSGRSVRSVLPGLRSSRVYLVAAVALVGAIMTGPILAERVGSYIVKRSQGSSLVEAYESSRGRLMREMWDNIEDKPLQGIGFGVASDPMSMEIKRDPVLGLPTSASIEKGVMPLAVLEELGLFGFIAVAAWIWMLLRRSARGGVAPLAVATTALLLNMGESTLFSPGGMGLLSLTLFGWTFACGQPARREP